MERQRWLAPGRTIALEPEAKNAVAIARSVARVIALATEFVIAAASTRPALAADTGVLPPEPTRWLTPSLVYDGALFANLRGGLERGATYTGNLNLRAWADLEQAAGLDGWIGYGDLLWIHGGQPATRVGDAQSLSNIAASPELVPYELWLQHNDAGNRHSWLAGLYDLNSEFYRLQASTLFLNSAFGIGPEFAGTGIGGPSIFPHTAAALRYAYKPSTSVVLRAALLDGAPFDRGDGRYALRRGGDGALWVGEAAFVDRRRRPTAPTDERLRIGRQNSESGYDNKLAFGLWHYTTRFDDLSQRDTTGAPIRHHGSSGAYAIGEALLRDATATAPRLSGFVQAGIADRRVDRDGSYLGAGLVAVNVGREGGELGLALARARNSNRYRAAQRVVGTSTASASTSLELSYLLPLGAHAAIQPDVQYVIHPDRDPSVPNAIAFQLRFELSY